MEVYAFIAAFVVQIIVGSVLYPSLLIRHVRGWAANFGSARMRELFPERDYQRAAEVFARSYRTASVVIAIVGLGLLAWMFTLLGQAGWSGRMLALSTAYFFLQMSPLLFLTLYALIRYRRELTSASQETKRKASLERRGLFDYVSPLAVVAAIAGYALFVAFSIYLDREVYHNATLSQACLLSIGVVTLMYAVNAAVVYMHLYGKRNPLLSAEGRKHVIGVRVKSAVHTCIWMVSLISLVGLLGQPGWQDWKPFAMSVFFVISLLLAFPDLTAPRSESEPAG